MTGSKTVTRGRVDGFVSSTATELRHRWRQADNTPESFPAIAARAISDGLAREPVTGDDVLHWVLDGAELPFQPRLDETFGQPPVTLYHDGEFQLDALYWVQSSTDVHGHGFSGAFAVLDGQSVHTRFEFSETHRVDDHFMIGRVVATDAELLDVGAVHEIHEGPALIHSVVHLGCPSVTLVARTCGHSAPTPEYAYFPPAIALDPSKNDPLRTRTVQLVRMLIRSGASGLGRTVEALITRCDVHTAFLVVRELSRNAAASALVHAALGWSDARWPGVAGPFGDAVEAELRHVGAVTMLHRIAEPDHRVVLGALAALDEPSQLRRFLRKYAAAETDSLIADFVRAVKETGALNIPVERPFDHMMLRPLAGEAAG
ncbi:hypothetical protein GCM10010275_38720 [Streptomyces litmocidini]|uniref:hypothetical protein n=1 Tax=Streptomyces litmocidini TaxID=67318 RepID=UPI00167E42A8|nr:hypothetical protein [Streptomyces litmocidini]GGU96800.1 hypothetical protein GCM10010275_38720 [Streptomyces litmocidini]